jgi:MFS family permease
MTLIGVAAAGALLWLATTILPDTIPDASAGEYWAAFGFVALGGLAIALSQLLGGWTKWGWPRVSSNVFLLGFLPALIAGGWILAAHEPESYWLGSHVRSWSNDIGVDGFVDSMGLMIPAVAFGIGLAFGLTFDTTGPRIARTKPVPAAGAQRPVEANGNGSAEDRRVRMPETESQPNEPAKN